MRRKVVRRRCVDLERLGAPGANRQELGCSTFENDELRLGEETLGPLFHLGIGEVGNRKLLVVKLVERLDAGVLAYKDRDARIDVSTREGHLDCPVRINCRSADTEVGLATVHRRPATRCVDHDELDFIGIIEQGLGEQAGDINVEPYQFALVITHREWRHRGHGGNDKLSSFEHHLEPRFLLGVRNTDRSKRDEGGKQACYPA